MRESYQGMPGSAESEGFSERERLLRTIEKMRHAAPQKTGVYYEWTKNLLIPVLQAVADRIEAIEKKGYFIDIKYDTNPPLFVNVSVEGKEERLLILSTTEDPNNPQNLIVEFNAAVARLKPVSYEPEARPSAKVIEIPKRDSSPDQRREAA